MSSDSAQHGRMTIAYSSRRSVITAERDDHIENPTVISLPLLPAQQTIARTDLSPMALASAHPRWQPRGALSGHFFQNDGKNITSTVNNSSRPTSMQTVSTSLPAIGIDA